MYVLKFAKTYGFGIMEKNNLKQVIEDKFYADDEIFCIADGVTRDLSDGSLMKYPSTVEEAKELIEKYPNPSGAAKAAEVCVNSVVQYLKNNDLDSENFSSAIENANNNIRKINLGRTLNYTSEDEYCCTSVGGIISDEILKCFSIGDSGIKVIDKDFNVLFDSCLNIKAGGDPFLDFGKKIMPNMFSPKSTWYRKYCRKYKRNNLLLLYANRCNIGVLNGKKKSLKFVMEYNVSLKDAKYIIAFSDGCIEEMSNKDGIKKIIENPECLKETKSESTLIMYEKIV